MNINKPVSSEAYKIYKKLKFNKAYRDKIYRQRYSGGYTVEFIKALLEAQELLNYEKENAKHHVFCGIIKKIKRIGAKRNERRNIKRIG